MPSSDLVQGFNVLQFSLLPFGANLLCLNYSRLSVFIVVHPSLNLNLYPCVNVVVVYVHPPPPIPVIFGVLFVVFWPELRPVSTFLGDLRPSV